MADFMQAEAFATVHIEGDGWEFTGPAWAAWRIRYLATRMMGASANVQTSITSAAQLYAAGGSSRELALQMLDDDWRCGNEPHKFPPRPHWTDLLAELGEYADSLPAKSPIRASALDLAQVLLGKAAAAERG
jgi:hypothetical protein